jgi:hypothetical protein
MLGTATTQKRHRSTILVASTTFLKVHFGIDSMQILPLDILPLSVNTILTKVTQMGSDNTTFHHAIEISASITKPNGMVIRTKAFQVANCNSIHATANEQSSLMIPNKRDWRPTSNMEQLMYCIRTIHASSSRSRELVAWV